MITFFEAITHVYTSVYEVMIYGRIKLCLWPLIRHDLWFIKSSTLCSISANKRSHKSRGLGCVTITRINRGIKRGGGPHGLQGLGWISIFFVALRSYCVYVFVWACGKRTYDVSSIPTSPNQKHPDPGSETQKSVSTHGSGASFACYEFLCLCVTFCD